CVWLLIVSDITNRNLQLTTWRNGLRTQNGTPAGFYWNYSKPVSLRFTIRRKRHHEDVRATYTVFRIKNSYLERKNKQYCTNLKKAFTNVKTRRTSHVYIHQRLYGRERRLFQ